MNIIVAEDDPLHNEILTQILKNLGHEVRAFLTGDEAWAAFQEKPADVVVSDWVMPGMSGLDFCHCLRQSNTEHYAYFIMVTGGRTGSADHDAAVRVGVDDFLIKPVHIDQIWRRLFVAGRILDFTNRIKELKALLPSCMCCKRIRADSGYWQSFEAYIGGQANDDSTAYVCPECQKTHATPT